MLALIGIVLLLCSPLVFLDPNKSNLTTMFVHLLKDSLNEYAYAARLAGIGWNISSNKYGLQVSNFVVLDYGNRSDFCNMGFLHFLSSTLTVITKNCQFYWRK